MYLKTYMFRYLNTLSLANFYIIPVLTGNNRIYRIKVSNVGIYIHTSSCAFVDIISNRRYTTQIKFKDGLWLAVYISTYISMWIVDDCTSVCRVSQLQLTLALLVHHNNYRSVDPYKAIVSLETIVTATARILVGIGQVVCISDTNKQCIY